MKDSHWFLPEHDPKTWTFWFVNAQPWQKASPVHPVLVVVPHYSVYPRLLHETRSSPAVGPSLERLFLSLVPLLPHHFLRFHSAEQPHGAITPSALCRIMISFPFLPNNSNVTRTAGIYRGRIPASFHDIRVVSTSVGTRREE